MRPLAFYIYDTLMIKESIVMNFVEFLKPTKWRLLAFLIFNIVISLFFGVLTIPTYLYVYGLYGTLIFGLISLFAIPIFYFSMYVIICVIISKRAQDFLNEREKQVRMALVIYFAVLVLWCLLSVYFVSHPFSVALCSTSIGDTRTGCFTELALKQQDEKICDNIISYVDGNTCIMKIAVIKHDVALCRTINHAEIEKECFQNVVIEAADSSFCESMVDREKSECFYDLAMLTQNESLCEKMDVKYSGYIKGSDMCFFEFARKKQDRTLCEHIIDVIGARKNCLNEIK